MIAWLHLNRLQRKILLVILVIVVVPMLVTGVLSASWIAARMEDSIESWIREAAQLNQSWLATLHGNGQLLADALEEIDRGELKIRPGHSPVPERLAPLARELGISLIQVYDTTGKLVYSSQPVTLTGDWQPTQSTAVVKASRGDTGLLAAVTIVPVPREGSPKFHLVLGATFDKTLLQRFGKMTGLKTRLFYPREGDFSKGFSEQSRPLKLRLPPSAYARLKNRQEVYSPQAENGQYWGLYTPVVDSSGHVEAVLFSGLAHRGGDRLLTDQVALSLDIVLLGTLLATAMGIALSRVVVRPVQYLRDAVVKVAAQDFRASVPIHSRDELGELAAAFNAMAATLREARDEQRREFQRDKIAALGELSLAMAHEIRNPIGVINAASNLLDKGVDPDKRSELYRVIHEESRRLDQLLKDFQQLARHRKPVFVLIDPAQPLEDALRVMLAGRDDITIQRDFRHAGRQVQADPDLLRQSWVNLVRNALEAMGAGPGQLRVGSELNGAEVILYLQDSGPGVALETVTRLFEPFYTTKAHGSGLGLTIASTLAEANGACLELVPGEWRGARFAMRLALAEAQG
jgi:signal transduction histidine kinase